MKKDEININDIIDLINSLSDDVDIKALVFNSKKQLVLQMEKTISTVHTIDKQVSIDELMELISQLENYSAIDEN